MCLDAENRQGLGTEEEVQPPPQLHHYCAEDHSRIPCKKVRIFRGFFFYCFYFILLIGIFAAENQLICY